LLDDGLYSFGNAVRDPQTPAETTPYWLVVLIVHRLRIQFPRLFQVVFGAVVTVSLTALSLGQQRSDRIGVRTMTAKDRFALESAVRNYQNGDAQTAEPVLQGILRRYPDNAEALESLGLIYADRNQIERALPLLKSACDAQLQSPIVFENLGITYLKLGRNGDAVRALRRAATLQPDSSSEAMLGLALMRLSHYAEAVQAFQAASESAPENQDNRYNWALALFMAGDLKQAGQQLQTVAPADLSAQEQALLGDIREGEGRFAEAVEHYRVAARLDPSEANIHTLGLEFLRHSVFDGALLSYSEGLSRYPSSSRMMFGLALSRYGYNDFTGAAELLSKLLRSNPHNKL
jgi:Flp pilus assembly protein TadD